MKKRLILILLSLVLICSMTQIHVYAADDVTTYGKVEISSASDITEGTYLIYGISSQVTDNGGSAAFMSAENSTKTRLMSTQFSIVDGCVTTTDSYSIWELIETDGGFYIRNAATNTYLYYGDGSGNSIYQTEDSASAGVWTVVAHNEGWTLQEVSSGRQLSCNRFGSEGSYYLGFAAYETDSSTKRILEFYKLGHSEDTKPDHTHSYTAVVTAPTCTEKGYTTYTCACGDVYTDNETAALGHVEVNDAAVAASCTEDGLTEGSHCSVCEEILNAQERVPAMGHSWDDGVISKEATEDEPGIRTYTCDTCGSTRNEEIPVLNPNAPTVVRISGDNRAATALAAADKLMEILGADSFDTVIIASGDNFADALAGSYLAAKKNAPILLYTKNGENKLADYVSENMNDSGSVYILGGVNSVPQKMEDALADRGFEAKRLAGDNRFATNLAILEEAGVDGEEILVCTAYNFADSLSASAVGQPILLVNKTLTGSQKEFISGSTSFAIIGGINSVTEEVEADLKACGTVVRVSGESREETSAALAKRYFAAPEYAVLAYSRNFPDGLCGGPLAFALGAPLLLTNSGAESAAAEYVAEKGITRGIVLGGPNSISDKTVNIIFTAE